LVAEAAEDVIDASARLAEAQVAVADSAREVETLTEAYEELKGAMGDVADLTENQDDLDRNLRSAKLDLLDAQDKYSEAMSGGGKNSREAKSALEKYNDAIEEYGTDSDEAARAQNKYNNAVSQNTVTVRERARAGIALERAQDRVSDIEKKQIGITEELTEADGVYTALLEKNGVERASDLKTQVDKMNNDHKVAFDLVHQRELELAEAEDIKALREEDLAHYGEILEAKKRKTEEVYAEIKRIQKGEVEAGEKAIDGFVSGVESRSGEVGAAMDKSFKEAENKMPHSDAKEGPFSELTKSGRPVVETFAKGMESGSGTIASGFSGGIAPAAASLSGSGTGGDTYGGDTLNVGPNYLSRDYDFMALMKDVESYQSAKRVQRGIRTL